VARVPLEDWHEVRVRDLAVPAREGVVVSPGDELGDALVELAGARDGRALVLDDGRLAGLLSMTDVSRLLEVGRLRLAR
jgi:CBS domain-containing protein